MSIKKKIIIWVLTLISILITITFFILSKEKVVINSVKTYQNGEQVTAKIISLDKTSDIDKEYFNKEEFSNILSRYKESELYQLKYKLPNGMTSIKLIPEDDYKILKDQKEILVTEKKTTIINVSYLPTTKNKNTLFSKTYKEFNIAVVNMPEDNIKRLSTLEKEKIDVKELNTLIDIGEVIQNEN